MYGRDKRYRPIVILDFGKVDTDKVLSRGYRKFKRLCQVKSEDFNAAITILLDLAIHYCHLPGKVESCIILLDTRNVSVTKLPITVTLCFFAVIQNILAFEELAFYRRCMFP